MNGLLLVVHQHAGQAFLLGVEQHDDTVHALGDLIGRGQGNFVVLAGDGLEHGEVVEQQGVLRLGEMQVAVVPQGPDGADDGANTGNDQRDGVTFFTHGWLSGSTFFEFGVAG